MKLEKKIVLPGKHIQISGSKSISNRLLVLRALYEGILISNLSDAQDTALLEKALLSTDEIIDVHHAGTAMRFLTFYFAIQEGRTVTLTGSDRMKQRPIFPLVNALRDLGADIDYLEQEGYPPLKIKGSTLHKNKVVIDATISSQFITSLLLIGAYLKNGLTVELEGTLTSKPYVEMTLKLLKQIGIKTEFNGQEIKIHPYETQQFSSNLKHVEVESDWSSASYFYEIAAISRTSLALKSFKTHSYQGDSVIKDLFWRYFGVNTITDDAAYSLTLYPERRFDYPEFLKDDLNHCPDIVQTICVTATALKIPFHFTGLATLKIKETDRLLALQKELYKIGCLCQITNDSIQSTSFFDVVDDIKIETYNDHRMAMAFAPYCLLKPLEILHPNVVEKSYPKFWTHFSEITANTNEEAL